MKKFIFFVIFFVLCFYIFHSQFYQTGKFNDWIQQYNESKYAQFVEFVLGKICVLLRKYDSAIFRFTRVVEIYSSEGLKSESLFSIASCYEEKKEIKSALKFYKKTFDSYPETYYGELAKKRFEYLLLIISYKYEE
jgi:TolA-binding protein